MENELRRSLGLIALGNFARQTGTELERPRQALQSGNGSVMAIDLDGNRFRVLRLSETGGPNEQVEALDSEGRWRMATDLVIVE